MAAPTTSERSSRLAMTYGWLWPGLPQLWQGGEWLGFVVAAGFALSLQTALIVTLVWTEWLETMSSSLILGGLATYWGIGMHRNRRWLKRQKSDPADDLGGDLFPEALNEYLQGNWFVAEQRCRELIGRRRHDADARLLLATVLRQAKRFEEARAELNVLSKLDGARKWAWEIDHERMLLEELEAEEIDSERADLEHTDPENAAEAQAGPDVAIRKAA